MLAILNWLAHWDHINHKRGSGGTVHRFPWQNITCSWKVTFMSSPTGSILASSAESVLAFTYKKKFSYSHALSETMPARHYNAFQVSLAFFYSVPSFQIQLASKRSSVGCTRRFQREIRIGKLTINIFHCTFFSPPLGSYFSNHILFLFTFFLYLYLFLYFIISFPFSYFILIVFFCSFFSIKFTETHYSSKRKKWFLNSILCNEPMMVSSN